MLDIKDLIKLAEQGYKPNDIKELLELAKSADPSEADNDNDLKPGESSEDSKKEEDPIEAIIKREKGEN